MLLRPQHIPDRPAIEHESLLWKQGYARVAGVDEVGRGPLAGPVVTAAVVFEPGGCERWQGLLDDSKQMTEAGRESAFAAMMEAGVAHGIGACGADEIDGIGIGVATRLAMARAIEALDPSPDYLLIDAVRLPELQLPQTSIIKGDSVSLSIAAASVIAKVTRDRLMAGVFEEQFPQYGFASHKGYGTAAHMAALRQHGPCAIHRVSFRPVREAQGISN
jgi:ribonuclease HII